MAVEEPFMQGFLLFPPQGVLGQLKKTWHKKYCQLFKASKSGIERLEIWDSPDDYLNPLSLPRIITLEACIKIGPSNQPKVFAVVTKTNTHHFGCYTEKDFADWINAFQKVAFKDDDHSCETIEEDNDLYCTSGEGIFSVKLVETEASKRCGLEPKNYTLIIAAADMKLIDGDAILFVWPYRFIRRYGYREGKFTFDAGRKCESGEGSFKLQHNNQQEIYRCISSKMQSMKQLLRGESISGASIQASTSIDLNDAQYHAALSMEAGSRSPLPPTCNASSVSFMGDDLSTGSLNSQKPLLFSSSSLNCNSELSPFIRPAPPIIKPKPAKPPRKYIFPGLQDKKTIGYDLSSMASTSGQYRKYNAYSSPESSRKCSYNVFEEKNINDGDISERHPYDIVEVRNNAWKTHGIGTIPHTEKINKTSPLSMHESKRDKSDYIESKIQGSISNDNRDTHEINVSFDNDGCNEQNNDHNDNDIDNNISHNRDNNSHNDNNNYDHHYHNDNENNDAKIPVKNEHSSDSDNASSEIIIVSPFIHNVPTSSGSAMNYDKLQHIGSLYKLDCSNPGYKTINATLNNSSKRLTSPCNTLTISVEESNPSWNDYDIVEDISSVRLADDSSRGYGVIRKKKSPPESPQHKVFNNSEYAIVSKPKRV
ncbi:hypothetical protein PV325_009135 [Microctonus aethiopoides]|nr:hypothetical protein PV325_009135 [Microctonus aethiopoides]